MKRKGEKSSIITVDNENNDLGDIINVDDDELGVNKSKPVSIQLLFVACNRLIFIILRRKEREGGEINLLILQVLLVLHL
jgi:hypothetical protein